MRALGRHATAKVLDQQVLGATQVVARRLALPQGAPVVRIQRVRLADGIPLSFDETYLPKELGEKVMADNLKTEPIFSLLEQKYNSWWKPNTSWKPSAPMPQWRERSALVSAARSF